MPVYSLRLLRIVVLQCFKSNGQLQRQFERTGQMDWHWIFQKWKHGKFDYSLVETIEKISLSSFSIDWQ